MISRIISFLFTILAIQSIAFAQRNFTLYQFQNTHQSLYLNPAFRPNIKNYSSGAMGLTSIGISHSGFVLNDLLTPRPQDDSLEFNVQSALDAMDDVNSFGIDLQNELIGVGIRLKKMHLFFNSTMKNQIAFFYPRDLFRFAFEGNGASFLGERASLDGLGFKLNTFIEYGFGANRSFLNDNLSIGVRAKVISGIYNAQTTRSELGLTTNDTTFAITIDGAFGMRTSYLNPLLDRNYFEGISNGFNFRNVGFGLDLGATYNFFDRLEVSASVIDLGFINWNANNRNFESETVNFTFEGIDLNQFLSDTTNNYLNIILDSVRGNFNGLEQGDPYRTSLNTRVFIGGRMKIAPALYANALWFNEFILGNYQAGLALGGTLQVKEAFTVSANYNVYGRWAQNLGVGVNFRFGGFQFFTMTDNLLGILNLSGSKNWHVNIGISASIGRPDDEKEEQPIPEE